MPDLTAQTLLVTISGEDRPGVTSTFFDAIADVGAEVLDLEQVVVRGHLTLAMLLAAGTPTNGCAERRSPRSAATSTSRSRSRPAPATAATGAAAGPRSSCSGAPLRASGVAAITARIAAHGANIDRIRRLSRYPVTTVEFDVSGCRRRPAAP